MSAGLRRLMTAWFVFGVLFAANVALALVIRHSNPLHGILDNSALGAFTWALLESFAGPWTRGRRAQHDSRRRREAARGYVSEELRIADDGDGCDVRRCS